MLPARSELHSGAACCGSACCRGQNKDLASAAWQDLKLRGREDGHGADGDFCNKRGVHQSRKLRCIAGHHARSGVRQGCRQPQLGLKVSLLSSPFCSRRAKRNSGSWCFGLPSLRLASGM